MTPDDRILVAAPLYHKNALVWTKVGMAAGASLVLLARFDQRLYVEAIGRYQVTRLSGVPTMFQLILNDPTLARTRRSSSVRFVGVGLRARLARALRGAPRAVPERRRHQRLRRDRGRPGDVRQPSGRASPRPATSIGYPLDGCEIRLDPGPDEGVLLTRNPGVMSAYHNLPEETARRLKDGWFDTSDVCRRDADGFYYFVGRTDDMFVCGGENVYPGDVEAHARAPPGRAAGRGAAGGSRAEGPGAGGLRGRAGRRGPHRAGREGVGAGPRPGVPASAARIPRPRAAAGGDEQDRSRGAQGARAGCPTRITTRRVSHVHRSPDVREGRRRRGRGRGGPADPGAHRPRRRTRTRCCSSPRSRTRRPSRSTTRSTRTSRRRPGSRW